MSRRLLSTLLIALGSIALAVAGCEPEFEDDFCQQDADCFPDEQCIDEQCVVVEEPNECGGAEELEHEVGEPCGPCDLDQWECADNRNELVCDGETECPDLDVITQQPSDVEATTATFNGEITEFPEVDALSELGFCWARGDQSPTFEDSCQDVDPLPDAPGQFSLDVQDLEPGSDYTVAAYFGIEVGHSALMNDVEFTTAAPSPENLEVDETADSITVSWDEREGATGYRVYADEDEVESIDDPETTSYEDGDAPAGSVGAPTDYGASADDTDGVEITWDDAPTSPGTEVDYEVVAEYPDTESDPSDPVTGQRTAPEVTGYELLIGDDDDPDDEDWMATDSDDTHFDDNAPERELTTGNTTAEQTDYGAPVDLSTAEAGIEDPEERTYRLRATWGDDDQTGDVSTEFTGHRGIGTIEYQWQFSNDDDTFQSITDLTGRQTTYDVTNLAEGQTYYFQAEVSADGAETTYTDSAPVTIIASGAAQLTEPGVSNITDNSADFDAEIDPLGTPDAEEHGFCWSTTEDPTRDDGDCEDLGAPTTTGNFGPHTVTDLEPGTRYYVRAYAHHDNWGTAYSSQDQFTTDAPSVEGLETDTTTETITVSWDQISAAAGYRVEIEYPDDTETTVEIDDPTETSHLDNDAPAGTVTEPDEAEAHEDSTEHIKITWEAADSVDGQDVDYDVIATYPDAESTPESISAGLDGPEVTGYEIDIGDDGDWHDAGDEQARQYEDQSAPSATIELGDTTATQADHTDKIVLETDEPTFEDPDTRSYRLQATYEDVDGDEQTGPATDELVGQRDHVETSTSYQWQRSDEEDGEFEDLTDVTDREDEDASDAIQDGETYWYTVRVSADGATTVHSDPAAGWVAVAGEIDNVQYDDVTEDSVELSAEIIDFGRPEADSQEFCYSTDEQDLGAPPATEAECVDVPEGELDNGNMETTVEDLDPATTYYFQAGIEQNVVGYTAESGGSFTTDDANGEE